MSNQYTIREGDRCSVQPTGDRCFDKDVHLPGVSKITFRAAMRAGYLVWEHPVAPYSERSYAVWTAKAVKQAEYMSRRPY